MAVKHGSPGAGPAGARKHPTVYDDGAGRCYLIETGGPRTALGGRNVALLQAISPPFRRVHADEPIEDGDLELRARIEVSAAGACEHKDLAYLRPLSPAQAFGRRAA